MVFLSGDYFSYCGDGDDELEVDELEVDELEVDEQPTQPHPGPLPPLTTAEEAIARAKARLEAQRTVERVCPVCVYYAESRGEHVEVGMAQLRTCAYHQLAKQAANDDTRPILDEQERRAYQRFFLPKGWPAPTREFLENMAQHLGLEVSENSPDGDADERR